MTDLFSNNCPCCGRPMPTDDAADAAFSDWWSIHPGKPQNKAGARRKFNAIVKSGVSAQVLSEKAAQYAAFCKKTEKPPRLPCTWLNQRGWEDETLSPASRGRDPLAVAAEFIKSGKKFACTQISAARVRELLHRGDVTADECKRVGLL